MNLLYKTLCLLVLALTATGTCLQAQELVEYEIKNLSPDAQGIVAHIQDKDVDIEVKVSDYTSGTSGFFIPCLNLENNYPQIRLNTGGTIDVVDKAGSRIWSVEYIACSTNEYTDSGSLSGVSTDGATYPVDNFRNKTGFPNNVTTGMFFTGNTQDVCRGYTLFIPDTVYQGAAKTEVTGFRQQVKTVRLIWGVDSFGGKSAGNIGEQPEIYGIKIKVVKQTSVGINQENGQQEDFIKEEAKGIYSFSQTANVELYNLSGRCVWRQNQTQRTDISHLDKGIYILKASPVKEGKAVLRKIVR